MRWVVLAPFATSRDESNWLGGHLRSGDNATVIVPRIGQPPNWHQRRLSVTGPLEWFRLGLQMLRGMASRRGGGVITVFPVLAVLAGLWKRLTFGRYPVVAYFFNTNEYSGLRRRLTRFAASGIDAFVVHTRVEGEVYSRWLDIDRGRFVFIHMQKPDMANRYPPSDLAERFVYATGSGVRDYATMFEAAGSVDAPFIVTPGHRAVEGLTWPSNVDVRIDVDSEIARTLFGHATVLVVPMDVQGAVAGTVTIAEALRFALPMVVTGRGGVEDYLFDGVNCLLVPPHDPVAMAEAINRLWNDDGERRRLAEGARLFGRQWVSDESAGHRLDALLSAVGARRPVHEWEATVDSAGEDFAAGLARSSSGSTGGAQSGIGA